MATSLTPQAVSPWARNRECSHANDPTPSEHFDVEAGSNADAEATSKFAEAAGPDKHRRRRCCQLTCCISCVCLTALVVLLVVIVGGRQIAQSSVGHAHLAIAGLSISEANQSSFVLGAKLDVSHVGPAGAELSAMDVDMFFSDEFLGRVHMPGTSIQALTSTIVDVPSQLFHVADSVSWEKFLQELVRNEQVRLQLKSTVSITAMGATFQDVDFDNTISVTGLGGLRDAQIVRLDLSDSTLTELVLRADICIKNPSDIAVSNLGDFDFALFHQGLFMGNISAQDVRLVVTRNGNSDSACQQLGSGYNFFKATGVLQPANHSAADDLISCYLSGEPCQVVARAWHAQGSHTTVFSDALSDLEIPAVLKGDQKPVITGLRLKQVMFATEASDEVSMAFTADVDLQSPLGSLSQLEVLAVSVSAGLEWSNKVIGHMASFVAVVHPPNVVQGSGTIMINATPSIVIPDEGVVLSDFMKELVQTPVQNISLRGTARVQVRSSALGYIMDISIPLSTETSVSGFDSFRMSQATVNRLDVSGGFIGGLDLSVDFSLLNPTSIGVSMGAVTMQLLAGGVQIGEMSLPNLDLQAGAPCIFNNVPAKYMLPADPSQAAIAERFLSNYVNGVSQSIEVRAATGSAIRNRLFEPALSKLTVRALLSGLPRGLVERAMMLNPSLFSLNLVPTSVVVQNPFGIALTVRRVSLDQYGCEDYSGRTCLRYYQESMGRITEGAISIAIPANGTAVTPYYNVRIANILSHESLQTILRVDVQNGGLVRIAGNVDVTIGQFDTRLHLEQSGVSVCSAGHADFVSHDPRNTFC